MRPDVTDIIRTAREAGWQVKHLPPSRKRPVAVLQLRKQVPNGGASIRRTVGLRVDIRQDPSSGALLIWLYTNDRATGNLPGVDELVDYLCRPRAA